ncbi:seven-hairpin glycosidase [Sistotremastrum suecicum HHB10207 ss-3]|uniref:alpha-1,2-Mannosidase n=1 Tax=Sistotremastrum suecicum HHB10207 ss-3 TaxID=1314776 RepID=A0A165XQS0_9AGAM|nr:seven-hairpin glycosidase [Sistotremastrum suecicum HHB10207 ss-3]
MFPQYQRGPRPSQRNVNRRLGLVLTVLGGASLFAVYILTTSHPTFFSQGRPKPGSPSDSNSNSDSNKGDVKAGEGEVHILPIGNVGPGYEDEYEDGEGGGMEVSEEEKEDEMDRIIWTDRAGQVKSAFLHAWNSYEKYAWGYDEVLPISVGSTNNFNGWGVSIVDSLDTLLLLGLGPQFDRAMDHINALNFTQSQHDVAPFFETTIRYLGGLLSAYALVEDGIEIEPMREGGMRKDREMLKSRFAAKDKDGKKKGMGGGYSASERRQIANTLLTRADQLGLALLHAFNTTSGLPAWGVNTVTHRQQNTYSALLAEIGSCQMEYKYLAYLTGRKEYFDTVNDITDRMERAQLVQLRVAEAKKLREAKAAAKEAAVGDGVDLEDDSSEAEGGKVVIQEEIEEEEEFVRTGGLNGMWGTRWDIGSGESVDQYIAVGALADSAYEYLLKGYLLSGRTEKRLLDMYLAASTTALQNLTYISPTRNLLYITDSTNAYPSHKFEHLSCFFPGLLSLGAESLSVEEWSPISSTRLSILPPPPPPPVQVINPFGPPQPPPPPPSPPSPHPFDKIEQKDKTRGSFGSSYTSLLGPLTPSQLRDRHSIAAQGVAETCWILYGDNPTGLGSETVIFDRPTGWIVYPPKEGIPTRSTKTKRGVDDEGGLEIGYIGEGDLDNGEKKELTPEEKKEKQRQRLEVVNAAAERQKAKEEAARQKAALKDSSPPPESPNLPPNPFHGLSGTSNKGGSRGGGGGGGIFSKPSGPSYDMSAGRWWDTIDAWESVGRKGALKGSGKKDVWSDVLLRAKLAGQPLDSDTDTISNPAADNNNNPAADPPPPPTRPDSNSPQPADSKNAKEKGKKKEKIKLDYTVQDARWLMRPETLESLFLMYRYTGDEVWRERCWMAFEGMEKYSRLGEKGEGGGPARSNPSADGKDRKGGGGGDGYVGYASVRGTNIAREDDTAAAGGSPKGTNTKTGKWSGWSQYENSMPSYALAETFKYIYLCLLDPSESEALLPKDKWIFNTEAHPFPVFEWSERQVEEWGIR